MAIKILNTLIFTLLAIQANAGAIIMCDQYGNRCATPCEKLTPPLHPCADKMTLTCSYRSALGSPQVMTFEGPYGFDLSNPQVNEVPLRINGAVKPMIFKVHTGKNSSGTEVIYSYRNPFFMSDIFLRYELDRVSNVTRLTGSWKVDHPPVLNLNCEFGKK